MSSSPKEENDLNQHSIYNTCRYGNQAPQKQIERDMNSSLIL